MRGSEFREWRKELGYTQQEAAKALDVTRATIQNWEGEVTTPPKSVPLACKLLLRRLKQRPDFGPVTLVYATSPLLPSAVDISLACEKCPNNQDAFRRLAVQQERGIFNPFVLDEMGGVIWSGPALLQMCKDWQS